MKNNISRSRERERNKHYWIDFSPATETVRLAIFGIAPRYYFEAYDRNEWWVLPSALPSTTSVDGLMMHFAVTKQHRLVIFLVRKKENSSKVILISSRVHNRDVVGAISQNFSHKPAVWMDSCLSSPPPLPFPPPMKRVPACRYVTHYRVARRQKRFQLYRGCIPGNVGIMQWSDVCRWTKCES